MKLLIADDEIDVREGIRYLIDWEKLSFEICGEGKDGKQTLEQILKLQPDVVLMDIRMPRLSGLEVVKQSKEQGFHGKFIILSGYSDFSYAQEAIRYGVTCYLTKPIDEDELEKAVLEARESLINEQNAKKKFVQYRDKARDSILKEILTDTAAWQFLDYHDLVLEASVYQVIMYTNYNQNSFRTTWDFADILRLANKNHNSLDYINLDNQHVIILKGEFALDRFQKLLVDHISKPQKGSPLDSLFLTYGRPVYSVEDIHLSYGDACCLMARRFFCRFNQHVLSYQEMPKSTPDSWIPPLENAYSQPIADYVQSRNRHMLQKTLDRLTDELYYSSEEVPILKHYLADIMIQVKSIIMHTYGSLNIPFPNNASIISTIEEKYYLYEIMQFFSMQFEMYMNAIGSPSRENIIDGILQYIEHNYRENLKLGTIAELFGYNSSYLGKVFSKTMGKGFNAYVDEIRINHSKEMLLEDNRKVYEISQLVGYKNVDYFHKKFRKYVGMSPAEYRKLHNGSGDPDEEE
ncbi:MAG: response regulator [Lachnospiraceae bacterium]